MSGRIKGKHPPCNIKYHIFDALFYVPVYLLNAHFKRLFYKQFGNIYVERPIFHSIFTIDKLPNMIANNQVFCHVVTQKALDLHNLKLYKIYMNKVTPFTVPYCGQFEVQIDGKGRVSIPKGLLPKNHGQLAFLLTSEKPIISIYDYNNLDGQGELQSLMSIFSRLVKPDSTNRVVFPKDVREHLGLEEETQTQTLMFVGTGQSFHVMKTDTWGKMRSTYEKRLSELLKGSGFDGWMP